LLWTNKAFDGPNYYLAENVLNGEELEIVLMNDAAHYDHFNQGSQISIYQNNRTHTDLPLYATSNKNPNGAPLNYTSIAVGKFNQKSDVAQIIYTSINLIDTKLTILNDGTHMQTQKIGINDFNALLRSGNFDGDDQLEVLALLWSKLSIYDMVDFRLVEKRSIDLDSRPEKIKVFDVNEDGIDEILLIGSSKREVIILDSETLQIIYENSDYGYRDVVSCDVNGDGHSSLVFNVTWPVAFIALDSITGSPRELSIPVFRKDDVFQMQAASLDPNLLGDELIMVFDSLYIVSFDSLGYGVLKGGFTGSSFRNHYSGIDISVTDLDNDGAQDILFGTGEGNYHYEYHPSKSTNVEKLVRQNDEFTLLDNPTLGAVKIKCLKNIGGPVLLTIYDVSGSIVIKNQLNNLAEGEVLLTSIDSATTGIYFLIIETQSGIFSKKIIKS